MTDYLILAGFAVALIFVARWVLRERREFDRENREGNRAYKLHLHSQGRTR